jgi:hypothetical protein
MSRAVEELKLWDLRKWHFWCVLTVVPLLLTCDCTCVYRHVHAYTDCHGAPKPRENIRLKRSLWDVLSENR